MLKICIYLEINSFALPIHAHDTDPSLEEAELPQGKQAV